MSCRTKNPWIHLAGSLGSVGLLLCLAGAGFAQEVSPWHAGRHQRFNDNWRFHRGEVSGAQRQPFDDSTWSALNLPHDWAIDGPFDASLNPQTGALPVSGIGWYRKAFTLPTAVRGQVVSVEFDAAMANSRVWLNGKELGGRPNGYIGLYFDLTPYLRFGGAENLLAVRLSPETNASRWYPGAGIYRNVWLDITGPTHIAHWGTQVNVTKLSSTVASVALRTTLRNERATPVDVELNTSIVDAKGVNVATTRLHARLAARSMRTIPAIVSVPSPKHWDIEHPYLYTAISEVIESTGVVDRYATPLGIRRIDFDRERGLVLNGRTVRLHGVCLHHDLGALGSAVNRRAIERQLQILQAAGVNAIRTSHNPPAPELLDLADRMGFLVLDEAFDMWRIPKSANDYSKYFDAWSEKDLRDMVRRDRNHPSIFMWSIGNEIPEQSSPTGWREARRLTRIVHSEDRSRPTTSAFSDWQGAIRNKLAAEVDIPGFNYSPTQYPQILRNHPTWIIYGSETASCVSSRGTYHFPLQKYQKHESLQLSGYDIIAPAWAYCPDVEFDAQERSPAVLGEFVWTGFDYLGEPTPYFASATDSATDWPARSSYFGMIDLAGFPKDRYFLYQSVWTKSPMVHLLPHWNWPDHLGQPIPVMVYTNADEVELFLNGQSLGIQHALSERIPIPVGPNVSESGIFKSKYRLLWNVPYAPGVLLAIARRQGQEVARDARYTADSPARVRLIPDRDHISADGDDLSFITARIEDAAGHLVPTANDLIEFKAQGTGGIEAVDNGNAASVEPFHADYRRAFNGLALLVIRSRAGQAGSIAVSARSGNLAPDAVNIATQ